MTEPSPIYIVPCITTPVYPDGWRPDSPRQRWAWSGPERQVLRERYLREGLLACEALLPVRSRVIIMREAARLGLRRQRPHQDEGPMTPEIERALRAYYRDPARTRGGLNAMAKRYNRSRQWLGVQARALGIATGPIRGPNWSAAEDALLESLTHLTQPVIQRRLAAAGYRRTVSGIACRLLHLGLRAGDDPDVLTAHALARLLGCDDHRVLGWIRRGALRARQTAPSADPDARPAWQIRRSDVRAFLIAHPGDWDHRTADHLFLIETLAGRVGPRVGHLEAA